MKPRPPTEARADPWTFPRKVLLVAFALLLALIVWQLLDLIMLVFGAVIVATLLRSLASALERHARLPTQISVIAVLFLLVFMIAAVAWFVGDPLAKQFEILRQRLPTAVDAVMQWLNSHRTAWPRCSTSKRLAAKMPARGRCGLQASRDQPLVRLVVLHWCW